MLDKQKDIDARRRRDAGSHARDRSRSAAMDLGKHVYVQKPLCWSVQEARHLAQKAKTTKVVTQMGNQGHSRDDARTGLRIHHGRRDRRGPRSPRLDQPSARLLAAGHSAPGSAHAAAGRPFRWNGRGVEARLAAAMAGNYPVPEGLAWDLFLGVAPQVDYHPIYHPFNWRGWVDWGQGALGDMGAHLIDHPFWALEPRLSRRRSRRSRRRSTAPAIPNATTTYYEFPARGSMPAVKLTWYDGGLLPPRPEEIGEEKMNADGGVLYIGSKGKLLQDTYGLNPRLLPKSLHDSYGAPASEAPAHHARGARDELGRGDQGQGRDLVARSSTPRGSPKSCCSASSSLRAGGKIHYDAANMKVTTPASANRTS